MDAIFQFFATLPSAILATLSYVINMLPWWVWLAALVALVAGLSVSTVRALRNERANPDDQSDHHR